MADEDVTYIEKGFNKYSKNSSRASNSFKIEDD